MKFTTTTNPVHRVRWSDFEYYVKEEFDIDYSFVADIECGNDSSHPYTIGGPHAYYDEEKVLALIGGSNEYGYQAHNLLSHLHALGKIPAGEWIVEVSW